MNLVFIAPPAAGKGTFSTLLNEKYGIECISTGQLLRDVDPESELGKKIRELQAQRILIDDETITSLLKEKLTTDNFENGFILDGFPRTKNQALLLEDLQKELNVQIDKAVYLSVDYETALKRTIGRRQCPQCKKTYNILTGYNTPKNEKICDKCNVELTMRNDDNEEAFKKGWDVFTNTTYPVVEYYKEKGKLVEISSATDPEVTFKELEEKLGLIND